MKKLVTCMLFAGIVWSPLSSMQAQAQTESAVEVEQIIVTATRREESLQEVPVAVTALSAEALDRAGVIDLRSLDTVVTSFNMNSTQTESEGTTLRIRGVGTTGNNIGLESAVGVFLDDVYLSRPGIALGDLMDVEQVEVLRGPQGTLFGRNTSSGAISIRTRKPNLTENESFVNVTAANFSGQNIQAGFSGPILQDVLGFRLSGAYRKQDGFLKSTAGGESLSRDRISLRGQLLWNISDTADLRLIADYSDASEQCCDAVIMQDTQASLLGSYLVAGLPGNGGVSASGLDALENLTTNGEEFQNGFDQSGLSAELNLELGGDVDLTWLTSFRSFDSYSEQSEFVGLKIYSVGPDVAEGHPTIIDIDTVTSELRLTGESGRLSWMVGAFLSDEEILFQQGLGLGADYTANMDAMLWRFAFGPVLGAAPLLAQVPLATGGVFGDVLAAPSPALAFAGGASSAGAYAQNIFTQEGFSWSVFTQNTIDLTDRLGLVVGLRWIDEKKDGAFRQGTAQNDACFNTIANAGALAAGAAGTGLEVVAGTIGAFSAGYACFPFAVPADVVPGQPQSFDQTYTDDELAWTAKLTYDFTNSTSAYASFTHGFKAGGFNLDATAAAGGASPQFAAETNDAVEIGLKSQFLDDRVRANLAVWDYDLENFQVLEFTGVQFKTFNVPTASSQGAEIELATSFSEHLDLNFGYTYADSAYPDDCDGGLSDGPPQVSTLCGALMTNSPLNTATLGFDYQDNMGNLAYFLAGNYRWVDDRRTSTQPRLDLDVMESQGMLNLRAGIGTEDGRWTLELWGANLTDERIRNVTFNIPLRVGARGSFLAAPRTYGLTLRTTL